MTISSNTPHDRLALDLVLTEAFRRVGLNFKLVDNPSERSLDLANTGMVDGDGLRIAGLGQQYPNLIQVPESIAVINFVAFSRDASIKLDQGWGSLKPHRIAFLNGWKVFESNTAAAKSITKVDKVEQLFQMLDTGRVDLALYSLSDGLVVMRRMGVSNVIALTPSLTDADLFLYLHKKHAAWVPQIAKALRDMKADGTRSRIMDRISAQ